VSSSASSAATSGSTTQSSTAKPRKLSFKDQRELEQLPEQIAELEKRQREIQAEMAAPGFYQSGPANIAKVSSELAKVGEQLNHCFERWELLENM
jgi:ATP-binding cassette subfamily F protein uup